MKLEANRVVANFEREQEKKKEASYKFIYP